jgi:hypothetical protein
MGVLFVTSNVCAEDVDPIAAAQFDKGVAAMKANDFVTACPAIAESYRLDPRAGTLFTLAECEAKWGKVASAYTHYDEYLQMLERLSSSQRARQKSRVSTAKAQRDALKGARPMLTITLPQNAPTGITVKRDGVQLGGPSLGVPLPVDPGEHVITVTRSEGASQEQRIVLARGEAKTVEVELPAAPPVRPVVEVPRIAPDVAAPRGGHAWTYVAFGAGAVGLAVGGVTGALVLGKKDTIDAHCTGRVCDAEGKSAGDSANSLARVSTVATGVGLAGAAVGLVLLLREPSESSSAPKHTETAHSLRPIVSGLEGRGAFLGLGGQW